jgi:hypothetical protein
VVERRIRELAAAQVPIRDPDVIQERERPACKPKLSFDGRGDLLTLLREENANKNISWFLMIVL